MTQTSDDDASEAEYNPVSKTSVSITAQYEVRVKDAETARKDVESQFATEFGVSPEVVTVTDERRAPSMQTLFDGKERPDTVFDVLAVRND